MRNNNKWINFVPYLFVLVAISFILYLEPGSAVTKLNYTEFQTVLAEKTLTKSTTTVGSNVVYVKGAYNDKAGNEVNFTASLPRTDAEVDGLMEKLKGTKNATVKDETESNLFMEMVMSIVPYILIIGGAMFILTKMNSGGANQKAFEFSKSKARLEGNIKVRFSDVAGCDEEKEEMEEIIDYLRSPKKFAKMGARIPKGILMVGSPGTGKTLLAKAVAGESDVPFYSVSGSDFVEMFVGAGAGRVRDMFKEGKRTAPCIIFIDEIDAVGRQRGAGLGGGHDEREQTLNQLLVEMDGINDNSGIVIIAATNRPDVLDPALLRPGRFDRQITVSLPDRKGRKAILEVHARNKILAPNIDLDALAKRTPGFSGAELENVLNEAAILAVRQNKEIVEMNDLDEAIDRVMMGPAKKSRKYDDYSKRLVAYHEAGHAIIGLFHKESYIVQKITIIPRGMAGGYNLFTEKEEKIMTTKGDMMSQIVGLLGGRTAEEIFFDDISTGASNDIERATKLARMMVTYYGMSELGPVQYDQGSDNVFLGRDYANSANVSGEVAYEIDQEIRKIIDQCHEKATEVINAHKEELEKIVAVLLEQETLTAEEIDELIFPKEIIDAEVIEKTEEVKPTESTEI